MQIKKKFLNHLNLLLILGFSVTIIANLFSFTGKALNDFKLHLMDSETDAPLFFYDINSYNNTRDDRIAINDSISIYPVSFGVEGKNIDNLPSLRDEKYRDSFYLWAFARNLVSLAIIILYIIVFIKYIRGKSKGNPFPRCSIIMMRVVVVCLLIYKLFESLALSYHGLSLRHLFSDSDYPMISNLMIGTSELALIFCAIMITEIMNIAGKIYNDNELTI